MPQPADTLALKPDSLTAGPDSAALAAADRAKKAAEADGSLAQAWGWLVEGFHDATGLSVEVAGDLLLSLVVIAALWALRGLVLAAANRRVRDVRSRYTWRKTSAYVAFGLAAALLLRIWLGALGGLATFLGLLAAGLAIALRDPLVNLAGWVFIVWKRPLAPGDRIQIRTHLGDVIDQRLFQFTLMEVGTETGATQSTGRLIHVPNGWVFSDSVVNWTDGFDYVWNEVAVTVSFESNWRAAKKLLEEIAHAHAGHLTTDAERTLRRAAQEYMIFYSKLTPVVYTRGVQNGIELTMRYLVEPRRIRGSEQDVWEAVLDAFAARDDVQFAYPTTRVFRNPDEGRPGVRPPGLEPAARADDDWAPTDR